MVCNTYVHTVYEYFVLHFYAQVLRTTDPDREGVSGFFVCKPPKFTNIPPCLAHTLACTDAAENVPSLTRKILVDFKTFASKD